MLFLKTKEEIAYELLSYPVDRTDYSSLTLVLANKKPRIYRERIERASSSFRYSMNKNSFRYYCGSGKEFKLSDAKGISSFFKAPNPPKFRGEVETHGTWWGVLDYRTTHFNSVDYSSWTFYTFIRSPSPRNDFCNLVEIYYPSRNVARSGSYLEFQKISYDPIWSLDNARPKIETLWTCKYETACELIDGAPIEYGSYFNTHNYAFLKQIKRYVFFKKIDEIFGVSILDIKRYWGALKDKDYEYVKYRTIIFILTWITVAILTALVVIFGLWYDGYI